jgi:hypothetical protein
MIDAVQKLLDTGCAELVIDTGPFLAGGDKPCIPQNSQVLGYHRLVAA